MIEPSQPMPRGGRRTRPVASSEGFTLTEVVVAGAVVLALGVPLLMLIMQNRTGGAALDKELEATASATAVVERLKTLPYDSVPLTAGETSVADTEWDAQHLRMPAVWKGGKPPLVGEFAPISGGTFRRALRIEEIVPWTDAARPAKLVSVEVTWTQPAVEGRARSGRVELRTLLTPAAQTNETSVLAP